MSSYRAKSESKIWVPATHSDGTAVYGYAINQGTRPKMEDAVSVSTSNGVSVYSVLDGHNGTAAVEFLKSRIETEIRACDCETLRCTLADAECSLKGVTLSQAAPGQEITSGTCAVVAVIEDDKFVLANVGDCRAVLCSHGKAERLTTDHSPRSPAELSRLENQGVNVSADGYVNGQIAVSRSFGDFLLPSLAKFPGILATPDLWERTISPTDEFLVLGCDGVFESFSDVEVVQHVRRALRGGASPRSAAEHIIRSCVSRKPHLCDNLFEGSKVADS